MLCSNPEIVAGQLIAVRNIYLRQELVNISNQIQAEYEERLPVLDLVSLAAYEQVFNRQPLSLPEILRQEAIKYGVKYYKNNMKKLSMAEVRYELRSNHADSQHPLVLDKENSLQNSDSYRNKSKDKTFGTISTDRNNTTDSSSVMDSLLEKKHSHGISPKIIVHRASNHSLASKSMKKPSIATNKKKKKQHRRKRSKHKSQSN